MVWADLPLGHWEQKGTPILTELWLCWWRRGTVGSGTCHLWLVSLFWAQPLPRVSGHSIQVVWGFLCVFQIVLACPHLLWTTTKSPLACKRLLSLKLRLNKTLFFSPPRPSKNEWGGCEAENPSKWSAQTPGKMQTTPELGSGKRGD